MKTGKALLILTGVIALTSVISPTRAEDRRQVWRDSEGQIVHDTEGTCVRSRWIIDHDPCATEAQHTVIAQADRTVYFAFNKADLSPEAKEKLDTLAHRLMDADDIQGARIVGYADRIGTASYNKALSKKRAEAVRNYLVGQGLLKPSKTETQWVGKSKPSANCSNNQSHAELIECLQPDRKVTVEIDYRREVKAAAPAVESAPPPHHHKKKNKSSAY